MRKIVFCGVMTAMMISMVGCGGKQQKPEFEEDTTRVVVYRDSTKYGICGEGSAMNTLELLTDAGDTMLISVADAKEAGQVFGGYSAGDRMAVMMNDKRSARIVINLSSILGDWVMPNPLDGSSEMGVKIKEGGVLEGIEQSAIIYKSWRIFNGKLEILSQREGGGDDEELNLYDMVYLGPDTLVFKDAEDTFEYSRQKHDVIKSKIKLEESSFDDFKM